MSSEVLASKTYSLKQDDNGISISETAGSVNNPGNTKNIRTEHSDLSKMYVILHSNCKI